MQSKGGFAFVNWDNFNTYKEIDCDDAYRSLSTLKKGRKVSVIVGKSALAMKNATKSKANQEEKQQLRASIVELEDTARKLREENERLDNTSADDVAKNATFTASRESEAAVQAEYRLAITQLDQYEMEKSQLADTVEELKRKVIEYS